ncbi:MAG: NTP transferase domain-containing protein [Bacteroidetes bacterium]|nr:MAG: NTP transferase domain-containing protein [Bacteroidota bacterium]
MNGMHQHDLWGIILAGGSGRRLQRFSRLFYGHDRPKQYCAFIGTRTMLRHTYDRARMLLEPERILTVTTRLHRRFAAESLPMVPERMIVEQPYCRETAAAMLLPLVKAAHRSPDSVVVVYPSDHFVLDGWKLSSAVAGAAAAVEREPESVVLLGVRPDRDDRGYGWIEQGDETMTAGSERLFSVRSFVEKPDSFARTRHDPQRTFWNTFIVVARTSLLLRLIDEHLPEWRGPFARYRETVDSWLEAAAIERAYAAVAPGNFSRRVLERSADRLRVMDISDVGWSDWGEERRIRDDAARFDLRLNLHHDERRLPFAPGLTVH